MFKSIIKKLYQDKSVKYKCSKCGALESDNDIYNGDYYYLERPRGKDFDDGYDIFAGGWYCDICNNYDWVISNDDEWLTTQEPDVVLPGVWKAYNDKRVVDEKEVRTAKLQEYELELKTTLDKVDAAIKVFTDDKSFTVEQLMEAGKLLIEELEERKTYTTHILHKQGCMIGLNNEDRRLLRCWGHDEVEYEDDND